MAGGDPEGALDAIDRAEDLYRTAMGRGGEAEGWRGQIRADALLAAGRATEALAEAERSAEIARERGLRFQMFTGAPDSRPG